MRNTERLPLLQSYIKQWATEKPDAPALIQYEDGKTMSYQTLDQISDLMALKLLDMGLEPGDRVATMLVLTTEHVALMYACFKIGVIIATMDVRLMEQEVIRDLDKIKPKAFFFLGATPVRDFTVVGKLVQEKCGYVEHLIQFGAADQAVMEGAIGVSQLFSPPDLIALAGREDMQQRVQAIQSALTPRTPALIIYTTGTTGEPKPAVLSHQNILIQNQVLQWGTGRDDMRILVNLPPSHVGCVTECLMTCLFIGGTAVLLRIFDPVASLKAIAEYKINVLGQIPTQYRLMWALPEFEQLDHSSLEMAIYGGSAVDVPFLQKMAAMAPQFGTGMGMTESAGFNTFTPLGISVEEMAGQVGRAFPELCPVTIRQPMKEDGSAGDLLPAGEIGEICLQGDIVFLGYFNQPEATAKVISTEGVLYTGDMGYLKDMGDYEALYLAGRRKFLIKHKGFQVYPDEVSAFLSTYPGVAQAETVGIKHQVFDEAIVAFIKPAPGVSLAADDIMEFCKGIASFKRPLHIEIMPEDYMFPINRVTKTDILAVQQQAQAVVEKLRAEGGWDR